MFASTQLIDTHACELVLHGAHLLTCFAWWCHTSHPGAEVLRNWRVWYQGCLWVNVATSMYGIIFFAPLMIAKMFSTPEVLSDVPLEALAGGNSSSSSSSTSCSGEGGHGGSGSGAMVALLSMLPFAAAAAAMVINASLAAAANERHRHAGLPIGLGALFMALTPLTLRYVAPAAAFLCLVLSAAFVWAFHGEYLPVLSLQWNRQCNK